MQEGDNGTGAETHVSETDPDIDQHEDAGDDHRHDGIGTHLTGDSTADILFDDGICFIDAVLLSDGILDSATLFSSKDRALDHDFCGTVDILELGIGRMTILFEDSFQLLFIGTRNLQIIIEGDGHGCTTGKVKAVVEGSGAAGGMNAHGYKADADGNDGDHICDLSHAKEILDIDRLLAAVVFLILKAQTIEGQKDQSGDHKSCEHG